jgi:hypothetical protein
MIVSMSRRSIGSPPVKRIFSMPRLTKISQTYSISSYESICSFGAIGGSPCGRQ